MYTTGDESDDIARLEVVQKRVRALAGTDDRIAELLRAAFSDFVDLVKRSVASGEADRARKPGADSKSAVDPYSLDRAVLTRFSISEYRTILLYRLGGLADTGSVRFILPPPADTNDQQSSMPAHAVWLSRFVCRLDDIDDPLLILSPQMLPPAIAEQMLDDMETWVKDLSAQRGNSQNAAGSTVSSDLNDPSQRTGAGADPHPIGGNGNAVTRAPSARPVVVVLWERAEHSERNIRLARTRSAYLEAHGNVVAALAALKAGGNEISRRTFYNHLNALDKAISGWRDSLMLCNKPAQMHGTRIVGTRRKSQGKTG